MRGQAPGRVKRQRTGLARDGHSRAVWWLHPRSAVLFLGIPLLIGAYLIPESSYLTLYRSEKSIDGAFLVNALVVYVGLAAGSFLAVNTGVRPQERDLLSYCQWFVKPLFALTMFGYLVWFAYAVLQAGGVGTIIDSFYKLLLAGDENASYVLKRELFQTIPGITTFTQFGILYVTVEALLWVRGESNRRSALLRLGVVFSLTVLRAILLSERLSLVEIIIPIAVIWASSARSRTRGSGLVRFAPLYMGLGVFGLFAFAEYFRSWNYFRGAYNGSYLEFAFQRFLGYYATSVNNAAVFYYHKPTQPLRNTLANLLQFPTLGEYMNEFYVSIFHILDIPNEELLEIYATPEFNTAGIVGSLISDFTVFLAPVAAFLIGIISVSLYIGFIKGRLVATLLYPSWFVGLLEISRIYYWPDPRYLPVLAFVVLSLLLFRVARVPAPRRPAMSRSRRIEKTLERR